VGAYQFAIGEMRHNLADAPLAGSQYEILLLPEDTGKNYGQ